MPFKANAARRHRIPRAHYRFTNWSTYELGPRRRGNLMRWLDQEAVAVWSTPRRSTPGGQSRYSDLARQRLTGYGRLNVVEATFAEYKGLIGRKLRARHRDAQVSEVALAIQVLNHMIREAKPLSALRS